MLILHQLVALFCFALQEEEVSLKQFLNHRYDDARIPADVGQRNHGKNCCTRSTKSTAVEILFVQLLELEIFNTEVSEFLYRMNYSYRPFCRYSLFCLCLFACLCLSASVSQSLVLSLSVIYVCLSVCLSVSPPPPPPPARARCVCL